MKRNQSTGLLTLPVYISVVALLLAGMVSCTNAVGSALSVSGSDLDSSSEGEGSTGRGSSVRIEIPALSAAFLAAAGVESMPAADAIVPVGTAGRAFLAVSSVKLELFASDGTTLLDSWTLDQTSFNAGLDGSSGSFVQTLKLNPGTGYTLRATLLNAANGPDESSQTTVRGVSGPFDIVMDSCSYVAIHCLPVNPTVLSPGVSSDPASLVPFRGSYDAPLSIQAGGEKWYAFTATAATTRISAQTAPGSQAVLGMFVYEADGITMAGSIAGSMGLEPGEGSTSWISTVPGQAYYIGVFNFGSFQQRFHYQNTAPDPKGSQSCTLSFHSATQDQYESNNTIQTATELLPDLAQEHSLYPRGDVDYFAFTGTGGTTYRIETSSVDTTTTSTNLEILNATGAVVGEASTKGKFEPGFSCIPTWVCPADGVYYLKVTGAIGMYEIAVDELPPKVDLDVVVGPGILDPHQSVLVNWDAVPEAVAYQLWVSVDFGYGLYGPVKGIPEGEEPGSGDCQTNGDRLSYELLLEPYSMPGDTVIIQVSWLSDGVWSPLSSGGTGSTVGVEPQEEG